jgi:hypothetical protein
MSHPAIDLFENGSYQKAAELMLNLIKNFIPSVSRKK